MNDSNKCTLFFRQWLHSTYFFIYCTLLTNTLYKIKSHGYNKRQVNYRLLLLKKTGAKIGMVLHFPVMVLSSRITPDSIPNVSEILNIAAPP